MVEQLSSSPMTTEDTTTQAGGPRSLLDDEVAHALHDAFLMGWSLQELKSKILLETLYLKSTEPDNGSSERAAQVPPFNEVVDYLLKMILPSQEKPPNLNASISRVSTWRATLNRIASLHSQSFPYSTTKGTPYDPSPTLLESFSFPYLYLSISKSDEGDSTGFISVDKLKDFNLYDLTQRALNSLIILYTKPEDSLVPDIIGGDQRKIVNSIRTGMPASDGTRPLTLEDDATQSEIVTTASEDDLTWEAAKRLLAYFPGAPRGPHQNAINLSIKFLSFLLVRFLENWDGYLRENFHIGGRLPTNELELNAYEAGRSLSSLSWDITLQTVPLENASQQEIDSELLSKTWIKAFNSRNINTIQRQISSLGPALDDAYYRVNNIQRPIASVAPERSNRGLPSRSIHAVTNSLTYWQRAVEKVCSDPLASVPSAEPPTSAPTGALPASTPTTDTSTNVKIKPIDKEVSRQLHLALINQAGIWLSLILGEQTLASFSSETVTKSILNNFMQEFENALKNQLRDTGQMQARRYRIPLIAMGVLLLIIVGGFIFLIVQAREQPGLIAVITLIIGSVLSLFSTGASRVSSILSPAANEQSPDANAAPKSTNPAQLLNSIFGAAEGAIGKAFHDGEREIRYRFDDLNHSVAITFPLVEFFTMHSSKLDKEIKITGGYKFLTEIVWTSVEQEEEIKRIASAAFGPLGAIISAQSTGDSSEDKAEQAKGWWRWWIGKGEGVIEDTFKRADQIYWGKASDGHTWRGDAHRSKVFSIAGNAGLVGQNFNGWTNYSAVLGPVATSAQVKFTGSISKFDHTNLGALLRWKDGNNFYKAYIDGSTLAVQKKVKGTITLLKEVAFIASPEQDYTLRFRVDGSTLFARVWQTYNADKTENTEPTNWMIMVTDTSLKSGYCGLRMLAQNDAVVTIKGFSAKYNNM